jgi:methionyl-tRNA formyltransferase
MNFAFFGTPHFSAVILEKLIEAGFVPSLVATNPDMPVGRKKIVTTPPIGQVAKAHSLPLWQPTSLRDGSSPLTDSDCDFFLVVAYGKLIPKEILDIPRLGTINVHPSLLPRHRGPTPIQTAILEGDEITGVSLILLDEEIDHGPLLAQQRCEILDPRFEDLSKRLAELSAQLLIETLPKYLGGRIMPQAQDHSRATFTKKFTIDDAFVPYEDLVSAVEGMSKEKAILIDRMVRALNPEPGVWTETTDSPIQSLPKRKRVKLLEARLQGEVLQLKKIQVEGKGSRML